MITNVGGLKEQVNSKTCEIVNPDVISIKNGIQKAFEKIIETQTQESAVNNNVEEIAV